MWSWFFLSCVNFMRGKQFWQFKEKFLRELKLWTWKRIGAEKKDVIQIFLSCVIFMRLCAAHRRTILRNKIKVFERDEFCTWKHIGAQKKDVILIFFHVSFTCVYARRTDAQFWQLKEKFLREMNFAMVYFWTYVHPSYCPSDLLARGFTVARWTYGRSVRPPSLS